MARSELLTSFYFSVRVLGERSSRADAAFQEVSGMTKEIGTEDVVSGGENRFKYRLPTQASHPNLVMKRGITLASSPLIEWCQDVLDGGFGSAIQTKTILVSLLNAQGQAHMSWSFNNAYPIKWSMSDLKSQESTLLIETLEFAYRFFEVSDQRISQYAGSESLFGSLFGGN